MFWSMSEKMCICTFFKGIAVHFPLSNLTRFRLPGPRAEYAA